MDEVSERELDVLCPLGTLSAHFVADQPSMHKVGTPGNWTTSNGKVLAGAAIESLRGRLQKSGLVELQYESLLVTQIGPFRVVHIMPPLSKRAEISIIRMTVSKSLAEYKLPAQVSERLNKHHGVLIAGAPGQGKSTFVSAMIKEFATHYVVKTVESPRDLVVPQNVTQLLHTSDTAMLRDVLLLSRPDVVCIDEIRHKGDCAMFADLRLCGVGCFGVIHATAPIDAAVRFVNNVGIGSLAHTLDTIVFVDKGAVARVLDVSMTVKVPAGMKSKDLTRPVVIIRDLLTMETLYEVFSFADQIIVHDPSKQSLEDATSDGNGGADLRIAYIEEILRGRNVKGRVEVEGSMLHIHVSKTHHPVVSQLKSALEEKTNSTVHVHAEVEKRKIPFQPVISSTGIGLRIESERECDVFVGSEYVLCGKPSKKGMIVVKQDSDQARKLVDALRHGKAIEVFEHA